MKIKFAALLLLTPFFSYAQESESNNDFQLGFTLSPNVGWLHNTSASSGFDADGISPGFAYGVLADFGFARNYYFSTALTVSTINGDVKVGTGTGISQQKYKLQYLEIPLTLKLKSNINEMGRFYGQFGLGTGINIGAKKDIKGGEENISIGSEINTFRLGLIAGGGAEWTVGKNVQVLTGLTWNNGFTKLIDDKSNSARNSYVALNLGVFF